MKKRFVSVVLLLVALLMVCWQASTHQEEPLVERGQSQSVGLEAVYPSRADYEHYEQCMKERERYQLRDNAYDWEYRMYQIDHAIPDAEVYQCKLGIATYANLLVPHNQLSSDEWLRLTMELPQGNDEEADVACTLIYPSRIDQGERAEVCAVAKTSTGKVYVGKCEVEALDDLWLIHGDGDFAVRETGFQMSFEDDKVFFELSTSTTAEVISSRADVTMRRGGRLEAAHFVRTGYTDQKSYDAFDKLYATAIKPDWEYGMRYIECNSYAVTADAERLTELPAGAGYTVVMELPEDLMKEDGHYAVGVGYEQCPDTDEWQAYIALQDWEAQTIYRSELALPLGDVDCIRVGLAQDAHDDSYHVFPDGVEVYFSTIDTGKSSDHDGGSGCVESRNSDIPTHCYVYLRCDIAPFQPSQAE